MVLANSQLIPEVQYYLNHFVKTSVVNRYEIPMPVEVAQQFIATGTVVELLFSDTFSYDTYTYLYGSESRLYCWPALTMQRLKVYPGSQYMVPTTAANGGTNIFNLQSDDFSMLDALMAYRHDSTGIIIYDSTATNVITDSTTDITYVYANLNSLTTPLSKEIYLYLQFKINENYMLYNIDNKISDGTLLATCFELKLIDEFFQYMESRVSEFDINCSA